LTDALSGGGAEDLKLKHVQLSVHLEGLRNTWRESKAGKTDAMKKSEHEIEALASERRRKAIDRERWRRNAANADAADDDVGSGSSGVEDDSSKKSDDSAYVEANKSVEERVAQYNEIIAQQLHMHRQRKREEMFGSSRRDGDEEDVERAEPLYPPGYVPPPPRLPAEDSVSHTPAAADIVRQGKKPQRDAPPTPPTRAADAFTYDYFEMTKVREALEAERHEAMIETLKRESENPSLDAANRATSSEPRRSWREKMADSRWRVQKRIEARETREMMREFGGLDDDDDVRDTPSKDVIAADDLDASLDVDADEFRLDELRARAEKVAPRRARAGRAARTASKRA
jgi:hypothetical protein